MATQTEIRQDIEIKRAQISNTVDRISDTLHKKYDINQKIRENPIGAFAIAVGAGFVVANMSSSIGRGLIRFAFKSAAAAAGAYLSKQGMNYLKQRIKT